MKYSVGQVLYVVLKKTTSVYPMQVIKEITEKTMGGEVTTYMVQGGADATSALLISEIDGEIFDSADRAKVALIERATATISRLIDNAVVKSREWYPQSFEAPAGDPMALLKKQNGSGNGIELAGDASVIELPDGKKARVRSVKVSEAK